MVRVRLLVGQQHHKGHVRYKHPTPRNWKLKDGEGLGDRIREEWLFYRLEESAKKI